MRIAFFGTPAFALPTLEALLRSRHEVVVVIAQPDRPGGRGMRLQRPPVAELASQRGIPLLQPSKIDAGFLDQLAALAPELGVVIAYGKILPQALIDLPLHGCINVHASLLPKWRGAAPVQRSIEAGEKETGTTIMRIDRQLDHGPIFRAQNVSIGDDERAPSLFARLAASGGSLLVDVVNEIELGRAVETEQEHEKATHARKIEKEEGRVVWTQPAQVIYDRFRAFDPWPGSFMTCGDETLKILEMRPGATQVAADAGALLRLERDAVVVAAGDGGTIELLVIQRPGKRGQAAGEVFAALDIGAGSRLS